MKLFGKKRRNNSINGSINKKNLMQWGIVSSVFAIVIFVMVINFCVVSKNEAYASIKEELILKSSAYATSFSHALQETFAAEKVVAEMMENQERCEEGDIVRYAQKLQRSQENVYMVVIADNKGEGYTNEGERVNISEEDYFLVSRNERSFITPDDGILHSRAYVLSVPYFEDNISIGTIYSFISEQSMEDLLPLGAYDAMGTFLICDGKGNFLAKAGEESIFLENDQFVENMKKAKYFDSDSFSHVFSRMNNMRKFTFAAEYKGENKTFVSIPLGIGTWQYVTILNQGYIDRMVANEWSYVRVALIEVVGTALAFIIFIVVMMVINRYQYNERNKALADRADTDQLTGLNNKMATQRKIQEHIEKFPNQQCLFFLFDIDNFKKINDTQGHAFGDEVLRTLGIRMSNLFRVTDIVGRTGGDEFILFLKNINSDEIIEKEAKRFVDFFKGFQVGEYVKYSATSSIGAAIYPRDAQDYEGLYKAADKALYEAKRQGKNRMVFYNKDMEDIQTDKKESTPIESDMR